METKPYQVRMIDRNVRLSNILAEYGEATSDDELNYLLWLTSDEATALHARYSELLDMQPIEEGKEDDTPWEKFSVRLPKDLAKFAEALGSGNRSAGIVAALAAQRARGKVRRRKPRPTEF